MSVASGYVPNLGSLDVRPGSILTKRHSRYDLNGALWERVSEKGDAGLADVLKAATARVDPNEPGGDVNKHKLGLRYSAGNTVMVASPIGFDMKVSDVTVKANIKIQFGSSGDYVFDTTEPAPWYSFNDTEMGKVRAAALHYLEPGECVVIGVVVCKKWVWYISREANTSIGFAVAGAGEIDFSKLSVNNLADVSANVELNTVVNNTAVLRGYGEDSVAAFRVLVKRRTLNARERSGEARTATVLVNGKTIIDMDRVDGVLSDLDEDELTELVSSEDD